MPDPQSKKILLSAGGTGGHMFPAKALGLTLLKRGHDVSLVTDSRGLKYTPFDENIPVFQIDSSAAGKGFLKKIKAILGFSLAILKSFLLLARVKPDIVVGFGGYPSFPAVWAAQALRIPTILHEQNAVLGKANKMLAKRASRIALSHPQEEWQEKGVVVGNPVRADIVALYDKEYDAPQVNDPFHIFVMGGSLGASVFGDVLPEAFSQLPDHQKKRLNIVQQCREEHLDKTREAYDQAGIKVALKPFFNDVPDQLSEAHLFIGRSGASTVAEITMAGKPAIFVPYPHHADQQQKINALSVSGKGGAFLMEQKDFTPVHVLKEIQNLMENPEKLSEMARASKSCARPNAVKDLADLVERI